MTENNHCCTEVIEVQIIGICELQTRNRAGLEVEQDDGEYQVGGRDYREECHGPQWESGEEECEEAGYAKTQPQVAAVIEDLPLLTQPHELAQPRVVLYRRNRKIMYTHGTISRSDKIFERRFDINSEFFHTVLPHVPDSMRLMLDKNHTVAAWAMDPGEFPYSC